MVGNECLAALRHDHSDIRTMLDVLEATADRLSRGRRLDPQMVDGVRRFFDEFVTCHDMKEQYFLLPIAGALSSAGERPALLRLRWKSWRGRRLAEQLVRLLRDARAGAAEPGRLAAAAAEYAAHLRAQLQEEERWFASLLPRLPPDDLVPLAADFKRLERERLGPTGREWYKQLVADYRDIVATWTGLPPSRLTP